MKNAALIAGATVMLVGFAGPAIAQTRNVSPTTQPGASGYAPGQQDRTGTSQGASSFAPGQQDRTAPSNGASVSEPGEKTNVVNSGARR